jgi:hypothetical protein
MATRGTIAIENEDGSISVIYSHWDNYLEHNGKILQEHYNTKEAVQELINGGSISSLGTYIAETKMDFDRPKGERYTVFYSYRGENVQISRWGSFDDYEMNEQFDEYNYLFTKEGVWSVFIYDKQEWYDLEYLLQEMAETNN